MTNTRSSLESLQELYPQLVSLPTPRFTAPPANTKMEKETKPSQHAAESISIPSPTSYLLSTLAYATPLLCVLYITLLGFVYGCPFITDNIEALGDMTSISPDGILAAALLVSSVGLVTLGVGFLWAGQLLAGDERI